jgi:DNA-binding CsgD family transcriptional regulator
MRAILTCEPRSEAELLSLACQGAAELVGEQVRSMVCVHALAGAATPEPVRDDSGTAGPGGSMPHDRLVNDRFAGGRLDGGRLDGVFVSAVPGSVSGSAWMQNADGARAWMCRRFERAPLPPFVATRRSLMSDALWRLDPDSKTRAELGFHDFVRAVWAFEDAAGPRLLTLEVSGHFPEWNPTERTVQLLAAFTPAVVASYLRLFVRLRLLRQRLLESLSPALRPLAPLLADGHTERDAARMLGKSPHTVHEHARVIYRAWAVKSRFELRDCWNGVREPVAGR